jgi:hypothetical protein
MTEDPNNMTCQDFQSRLPELIGSGENLAAHSHLQSCQRCSALLADLKAIAEAAHRLLPIVEPPDDVWEHIESAIRKEMDSPEPKGKQE